MYTDSHFIFFFNGGATDTPIFEDTVVTFAHGDLYGRTASDFVAEDFQLYTSRYYTPDFSYEFRIAGPFIGELYINKTRPEYEGTYFVHNRYNRFNPSLIISIIREFY